MARESAYDQYIADLKKREQTLRDEIEKQSTQLEAKVKTGVIIGLILLVASTIFFLFFRRSSKKSVKAARRSKGNWIVRWILETVGMEVLKRFWQVRKAKIKGS